MRPIRHRLSLALALLTFATPAFAQVRFLDETFAFDRENPAAGSWLGNLVGPQQTPSFVAVVVEHGESGWTAQMTFLGAGALSNPCADVAATDSTLQFVLPSPAGKIAFAGTVSEDGQRLTGTAAFVTPDGTEDEENRGTFEFARTPRPTDIPERMAFSGTLNAMGAEMPMTVMFAPTPGGNWVGSLDVPAQTLRGFPLVNIERNGDRVVAFVPVPAGGASIEGTLDEAERRLTGSFRQSGMEFEIDFERDDDYAYREVPRPQQPKPPYPYVEQAVVVTHPDGFDLAGTLTIPEEDRFGAGPFPAAVLISGSGQQDRDESLLGHKPFLVIADHLTRHGIAVMRYDDRAVGGSGGLETLRTATSADFATDALAVVEHLRTLPNIDPKRIGLIGHSEGGMIAPMVGRLTDGIAFMVLLAGPGVPGKDLLLEQTRLMQLASGADAAALDACAEIQADVLQRLANGATREELEPLLRTLVECQTEAMGLAQSDASIELSARAALEQTMSEWMKFFVAYDPAPALRDVTCPVLALNGTLDLQVWHEQNLDAIERTMKAAGGDVTAIRYEGLNHLFQPAETGSIAEYVAIETTFDEKVLDDIVAWIEEKVVK